MAKNKRTDAEILQDKALITELILKGKGPTEIALSLNRRRHYNLTESQIRYDIGKIKDEWIGTYLQNYDQSKAMEIAKLDKLEATYWEAWSRSLRKEKKVVKSDSSMSGSGNFEGSQDQESKREEIKSSQGNEKFLKGIQWCIDKRCEILGHDEPSKLDITWQDKAKRYGIDPEEVKGMLVDQFVGHAERGLHEDNE